MSPAVSKKQRRLMGMALHSPSKLYKRNRGVLKMNSSQLRDFAKTKEKGLTASFKDYIKKTDKKKKKSKSK